MKFLLIFLITILISLYRHHVTGCHVQERGALQTFKSFLTDPSDRLSSWRGLKCCNWYGIHCSESLHVTALDLRNSNLTTYIYNMNSELVSLSEPTSTAVNATLSPSLFTLTHLNYLDLSYNFMFSKIPVGFANLTRLTNLNLSNAMFSGTITTELANLTSLEYLDLSCSQRITDYASLSYYLSSDFAISAGSLYTFIPSGNLSSSELSWLTAMSNLKELRLTGMDLSQASQSDQWAKPISLLSNLEFLQLSNCRIHGKIPVDQLHNLTRLNSLQMDFNSLSYQIPYQLVNLTSLAYLDLTNSNLQGSIPHLPQLANLNVGSNPDLVANLTSMFDASWPQLESLNIQSTQANGPIPTSFANTSSSVYFIAYNCFIDRPFPAFITNLSKLEMLALDMNSITGQLPSTISNLKNLQHLSLTQNKLEGAIPDSVCKITSLKEISLAMNMLSGDIPNCIGQLPNLQVVRLMNNKLNGTISSFESFFETSSPSIVMLGSKELTVKVSHLPIQPNFQLQILHLASCKLEGSIPEFIRNLTNLMHLGLSYNNLTGRIPLWLFNLPKLSYLDLSNNNLEGVLPSSILLHSNSGPTLLNVANNKLQGLIPLLFENIDVIDLSTNNFTGHVPSHIGHENIRYLSLSGNHLTGLVPTSLCEAGSILTLLDLSFNSLSGTIPSTLGNCTSLKFLNLGGNNLIGTVPQQLQHAKNLSYLDLGDNHLDGNFPSWIQKLQNLVVIKLGNNGFQGEIPPFIGSLRKLQIIMLASNSFSGSIPWEICRLAKLQYMDLSKNNLSGAIPKDIKALKMMRSQGQDADIVGYVISAMYVGVELVIVSKGLTQHLEIVRSYHKGIDLSFNRLIGNIPEEIGLLQGLHTLNLSHNDLSGKIPRSFRNMSSLESLDLSYNNLTGEIPTTFTLLHSLTTLNLSYNNLSGRVIRAPHIDTLSLDGVAYIGNKYLRGSPDGIYCEDNVSVIPKIDDVDEDNLAWSLFAITFFGYATGIWGFFAILFFLKNEWREKYWNWIDKIVLKINQHCKIGRTDAQNFR